MISNKKYKELLEEQKAAFMIVVKGQQDRINELTAQNSELFEKLMARDLPEYQTFKDQDEVNPYGAYDPTQDDGLAGEILDETELEGNS